MKRGWAPYVQVGQQQLANSLAKMMSFRFNFVLTIFVDVVSFVTFFYTTELLFMHISHIGLWHREHFIFFICWMQSVSVLHAGFLAPNFWNLAMEVRNGALDFRLLRPLGSLFDVFTALMRPNSLVMMPALIGMIVYYGNQLGFTVGEWIVAPFLWLVSAAVLFLLEILISMGLFWTHGGDGINFLRIHFQQFQRWPDFVYPYSMRLILTRFFPVLAAGVFPVRALFGQGEWWEIPFLLVVIVVLWKTIGCLWIRGLRRYESVSA